MFFLLLSYLKQMKNLAQLRNLLLLTEIYNSSFIVDLFVSVTQVMISVVAILIEPFHISSKENGIYYNN